MTYDLLSIAFGPWDIAATCATLLAWGWIGWRIEHPAVGKPSVSIMMAEHRRGWMLAFLDRVPRIFDAQILGTLRQGTAFFASTSMLALGGLLAVIGNPTPLIGVAHDFSKATTPVIAWQLKLCFVGIFLIYGFLKFVWASRLFGYCAVVMASVPNDPEHPDAMPRATMAGELNIRAAMNFNRGLRALYFALAALAWILGPAALGFAAIVTTYTLWGREFSSLSREVLSRGPDQTPS